MNPHFLSGLGAVALAASGLIRLDGLSPEERRAQREAEARMKAEEIAARRAASPEVAAAEAKRQRKAEKLRTIAERTRP